MTWDVRVSGDGVAIVCMESSRANEINDAFLDDLEAALLQLQSPPGRVRVAVFTRRTAGAVFSSGLDLFRNFNDRAFTARFIRRYEQCMLAVLTLPMVTVAALTGTVRRGLRAADSLHVQYSNARLHVPVARRPARPGCCGCHPAL